MKLRDYSFEVESQKLYDPKEEKESLRSRDEEDCYFELKRETRQIPIDWLL